MADVSLGRVGVRHVTTTTVRHAQPQGGSAGRRATADEESSSQQTERRVERHMPSFCGSALQVKSVLLFSACESRDTGYSKRAHLSCS
mmetsp:Transcript_1734/g.4897  ORF Transcript_1734/g.4897 Transcript_1734/m.4897 type:complete len:88 (-) Transcript_1734:24-287(-)